MTSQCYIQPSPRESRVQNKPKCKMAKDTVLQKDPEYRFPIDISRGLRDFDYNFKTQLHFVIRLNKRVSCALALRSSQFLS